MHETKQTKQLSHVFNITILNEQKNDIHIFNYCVRM